MGIARDFQLQGHQRLGILWEKRRGALQSHREAVNRQGWEAWVWLRQARVTSLESWLLASLKSQGSASTGAIFPGFEFSITHVLPIFFPSGQVFLPLQVRLNPALTGLARPWANLFLLGAVSCWSP